MRIPMTDINDIRIVSEPNSAGYGTRVKIGGIDVSDKICALKIEYSIQAIPKVTVEFFPGYVYILDKALVEGEETEGADSYHLTEEEIAHVREWRQERVRAAELSRAGEHQEDARPYRDCDRRVEGPETEV